MKLGKVKKVPPQKLVRELIQITSDYRHGKTVGHREGQAMEMALREYTIVEHAGKEPKGNVLWRLSFPLYFTLYGLTWLVLCPVKWLFTGRFYMKPGRFFSFIQGWSRRL